MGGKQCWDGGQYTPSRRHSVTPSHFARWLLSLTVISNAGPSHAFAKLAR